MLSILLSMLVLMTPAERDSLLAQYPANREFWEDTFQSYEGDTLALIEELFFTIPAADRGRMSADILTDHLTGALENRLRWYTALPDSIFLPYVLDYRIAEEPLSSYRSALSAWLQRRVQVKATAPEMAEEIRSVISNQIDINPSFAEFELPSPTQIIPVQQASREGRWILITAAMRSMGIAARPIKGWFPGSDRNVYFWNEVWDGEEWLPIMQGVPPLEYIKTAVEYPRRENITANYRNTGTLELLPLGEYTETGWNAYLRIPSGDDTVSVDGIVLNPFEEASIPLGPGEFIVTVDFQRGDELVGSWSTGVTISEDSISTVDMNQAQYAIVPLP